MQDYNTIIGVIQMHQNNCSYRVIKYRYHLGTSTVTLIPKRFEASQKFWEELKRMEPSGVETLIFPPANLKSKDIPLPDFHYCYVRICPKGSRINLSYCRIEYKQENQEGNKQSQFYKYYNCFVKGNYGGSDAKMPVERISDEKVYIAWKAMAICVSQFKETRQRSGAGTPMQAASCIVLEYPTHLYGI